MFLLWTLEIPINVQGEAHFQCFVARKKEKLGKRTTGYLYSLNHFFHARAQSEICNSWKTEEVYIFCNQ